MGERPTGTTTILLVEDDRDLRETAQRALTWLGYRVLAAGDGEEALRTFDTHEAEISVVLTDAGLPKLTGPELCRAIRERNSRVGLILASGVRDVAQHSAPQVPFLAKPWGLDELTECVERVLAAVGPARVA